MYIMFAVQVNLKKTFILLMDPEVLVHSPCLCWFWAGGKAGILWEVLPLLVDTKQRGSAERKGPGQVTASKDVFLMIYLL